MSTDVNLGSCGLSSAEFLSALVRSELFHEAKLFELRDRFEPLVMLPDATPLAERLVLEGVLTEFQAQKLLLGAHRGLVCGRYAVLDRIDVGAMGQVFKARHRLMDRIVALKMVSTQPKNQLKSVAQFLREMKIVGRLDHPNVVHAFDADLYRDLPYLVMEYLEGEDLEKLLARRGSLPADEVASLMAQAAWGLEHAHSQGVIHRDIKPTNLFLDKSGVVKVLDLGLGVYAEESANGTGCREPDGIKVVGTADYMSPEQISGRPIDTRTDLFSLGCTMYRLLTQTYAFPGTMREIRLAKRLHEKHVPITDVRPGLPYGLARVVDRLLAANPDDRFSRASEVAEALEGLGMSPKRSGDRTRLNARRPTPRPPVTESVNDQVDSKLNWSVIETAIGSNEPAASHSLASGAGASRLAVALALDAPSIVSHRKRFEADGEESGRKINQEYRKELIQLSRAMVDERTEALKCEPPRPNVRRIERLGERLGDFLGRPDAGQVLIAIVLVLIIFAALLAISLA